MRDILGSIASSFLVPEKTNAKIGFADIPEKITFQQSGIVLFGIPLEITTTFGTGTGRGPEAIRATSSRQIETLVFEEGVDISTLKIYDLGDLILPNHASAGLNDSISESSHYNKNGYIRNNVKRDHWPTFSIDSVTSFLDRSVPKISHAIYYDAQKIPVIIGGEHTLSYYSIKSLADERPLVIHFDAHRDMKKQYDNMRMCHTTPFYHLIKEGHIPGEDIIQIGIRQGDYEENRTAEQNGVTTFDAWSIHEDMKPLLLHLNKATRNRKIYITFDIDVYDLPYVPCTGTPEPFGLDPFQVILILKSIDKSAGLIGLDLVEVSARLSDYREGALATHTLYRIFTQLFKKER
ncbi:MAG TPA: arginase family protein [Nitrososphaeraceae archaeon]|nr:arginase family protein [Nitrososphaeraceae archaeon]